MTLFSIVATNIEKQYDLAHETGSKRAVDGVSFNIQEGERIGFIGANGAGKSTFLKILSKEIDPSSGSVSFTPGERMAELPLVARLRVTGDSGRVTHQGADGGPRRPLKTTARPR